MPISYRKDVTPEGNMSRGVPKKKQLWFVVGLKYYYVKNVLLQKIDKFILNCLDRDFSCEESQYVLFLPNIFEEIKYPLNWYSVYYVGVLFITVWCHVEKQCLLKHSTQMAQLFNSTCLLTALCESPQLAVVFCVIHLVSSTNSRHRGTIPTLIENIETLMSSQWFSKK